MFRRRSQNNKEKQLEDDVKIEKEEPVKEYKVVRKLLCKCKRECFRHLFSFRLNKANSNELHALFTSHISLSLRTFNICFHTIHFLNICFQSVSVFTVRFNDLSLAAVLYNIT